MARPASLNLRILGDRPLKSGTPHQEHSEESAGDNVEGHTEAGPPQRDTWILNHLVMKEIEDTVSGERGGSQPQIPLEADHHQLPQERCTPPELSIVERR